MLILHDIYNIRLCSSVYLLLFSYYLQHHCDKHAKNIRCVFFHLLCQAVHQLSVYLLKARPLLGVPPPAAQHEIIVDSVRATGRLWQVHLGA